MSWTLSPQSASLLVNASYLLTAFLFIMGLKRMSSPVTARSGIIWAGWGMLVATLVTFLAPQIAGNYILIVTAIFIGGVLAWWTGKRVAMTDMPQMIALYNGMGGGAAAAIAAVELFRGETHATTTVSLAVLGGLIGSISFSGSLIAFGKLQGLIKRSLRFRGQQTINMMLLIIALVAGGFIALDLNASMNIVIVFFALALLLGITQQVGFRLDPGWGIWAGHVMFLVVMVLRPQGLFPRTRE